MWCETVQCDNKIREWRWSVHTQHTLSVIPGWLVNHMLFVRQNASIISFGPVVLTCSARTGRRRRRGRFLSQQRPPVAPKGMVASLAQAAVTLLWLAAATGMPDLSRRDLLMRQEASRRTGGGLALTPAERRLDGELRRMKEREMAAEPFPPAVHFFKARRLIRDSPVFKLLQAMPKGGALHVHSSSLVSAEWLVKNATYRPHCYVCYTWDNSARFVFSRRRPYPRWDCFYWQLVGDLRAKAGDAAAFDGSLMKHLTLVTEDPDGEYPDQDAVWNKFERAFVAAAGLVNHAPVLRDYFLQGLHDLHRDNVMYLELRSGLSRVGVGAGAPNIPRGEREPDPRPVLSCVSVQTYELDGTVHDKIWTLRTFRDVTGKFVAEHPDFLGARLIVAVHRASGVSEVKAAIKEAAELRRDFPDVVAGFDLVPVRVVRGQSDTPAAGSRRLVSQVGREDDGRPLWYFRDALSLPARMGVALPYFFHAGETDTEGTEADQNLLDALLFNSSRIGHGYALARHPLAKEMSRVLKLVSDLRNHPAAALMAEGHPLVIGSDDPSMFGTAGLSYDFYQAFVGIGGLKADVGTLKELALNSIRYSSLPATLKDAAQADWQRKWDAFVSAHSRDPAEPFDSHSTKKNDAFHAAL
ncbi:adenosine deaminase 2-A isoform X3 [Syngnathoides biaculeatus]|uniref:adenosine deaminase 2-A isoform X3 n=1 Tax=Syngnathoides biaculeatus TaxID=300417 RepID=UPI002ADDF248|nr:adenosine deaminase 2-A isoform X3 [Syngnathoides biaculeatus]